MIDTPAAAAAGWKCRISHPGPMNRKLVWTRSPGAAVPSKLEKLCRRVRALWRMLSNISIQGLLVSQRGKWIVGRDTWSLLGVAVSYLPLQAPLHQSNNYQLPCRWIPSPPACPTRGTIHIWLITVSTGASSIITLGERCPSRRALGAEKDPGSGSPITRTWAVGMKKVGD